VRQALPLEDALPGSAAFRLDADEDADVRPAVYAACVKAGWTLLELRRERLDLETIFQRLTLS
jgi:hypothetical protein